MKYNLDESSEKDIERLIEYKRKTILGNSKNIEEKDLEKINNYINENIPKQLKEYKIITKENKKIGCVLLTKNEDGVLLDEIYIEEPYRNMGIGSDIIKNILLKNNLVYLWVYKENQKAIKLYKKMNFQIVEETENRIYMVHKTSV